MTTMEAVAKTEYTIEQLYDLALTYAAVAMRKERDRAEQENDGEAWLHYEDLRQAFIALRSSN